MIVQRRLHRQSIRGNDAGSFRMPSRGPVGAGQDGGAQKIGGVCIVFSKINEGTRVVLDLPKKVLNARR